jgi:hypothetical protein
MAFNIGNFGAITTRFGNPANFFPTHWIYNAEADSLTTVSSAGYFNAALATYEVNSGDKVAISTTTPSLSFSGTFRNNGAGALFVDWDRTYFLNVAVANISASASTTYFGYVPNGVIVQVSGVLNAAVTVAPATLTFTISGSTITGATFSVAPVGSGVGVVYTATPTANNVFTDPTKNVQVTSDGGSTTACGMIAGIKMICAAQV